MFIEFYISLPRSWLRNRAPYRLQDNVCVMCTHIHIWEFLFQDFCDSVTVEGHSEGARRSSVENHLNKKQGLNPGDKIHRDKKEEVKNAKSL